MSTGTTSYARPASSIVTALAAFGRRHVALRSGALPDSDLTATRLAPVRRLACASPGYLQRHGRPTRPEDLLQHSDLTVSSASRVPTGWWTFPDVNKGKALAVHGRVRTDDAEALLQGAVAGLGAVRLQGRSHAAKAQLFIAQLEEGLRIPCVLGQGGVRGAPARRLRSFASGTGFAAQGGRRTPPDERIRGPGAWQSKANADGQADADQLVVAHDRQQHPARLGTGLPCRFRCPLFVVVPGGRSTCRPIYPRSPCS